jgi:arylsulfatase A-like enzyme
MKRSLIPLLWLIGCSGNSNNNQVVDTTPPDLAGTSPTVELQKKQVIVFVWDGLRPDSITETDTPVLAALKKSGTEFTDNHSTYPTFTMMNAASFATGGFPGTTGFYGNSLWQEGPTGTDSSGATVNFNNPVFTEDYGILQDLDAYYNNQLLLVGTLFQAAQAAGLTTAAVGKSGPAFLQDYKKGGMIVDEKMVFPLSLAQEIQANDALPQTTDKAYPAGTLTIGSNNGTPTSQRAKIVLKDGVTSDPTDKLGAPTNGANQYMMNLYLTYVLPKRPDLTLIWFRSPDSPQHNYGPGAYDYHDALRAQDFVLGQLVTALFKAQAKYDIIIVSDHGHSSVSGPLDKFPLRTIAAGTVGAADPAGYSHSGDVRIADLLGRNLPNVFDGQGCIFAPEMSGHKADGTYVYTTQIDTDGSVCGKGNNFKYTTKAMTVPSTLPAKSIVVATNGGSDYIYVPDHDSDTVAGVVKLLQSREEVGAVFVHSRYGALPGTLPLDQVHLENAGRSPDVVFSYMWDDTAMVQGMPGIEFESMGNNRGMHGSFSPIDVHNTLIANGPDFKGHYMDPLPSGNVDVAPTVASILGLDLPKADGRVLEESLAKSDVTDKNYKIDPQMVSPSAEASGLTMQAFTDPTGATIDATVTSYTIELKTKVLSYAGKSWTYFDSARAIRK